MARLPRPDVGLGPHRDLADALHELHHRSGWPSLRRLAVSAACSHTTVWKAFSSTSVPSWGTVELLVESMGGDVDHFRDLWVAATSPEDRSAAPDIAGRTVELDLLVRHLRSGDRLLLVTGDAGIGKTTLLQAAVARSDVFVACGAGLVPLREEPFYTVAAMLRSVHERDNGQWLAEALSDCASFVPPTLARLLPELDVTPDVDDRYALSRLYAALHAVTTSLARLHPLALAIEDLQWVDESSLAYLEQQAAVRLSLPVVSTLRSDAELPAPREDQLARLRRGATGVVELGPLSEEETADQLRLLRGADPPAAEANRVHGLTGGVPLLTAQLAGTSGAAMLRGVEDYFGRHLDDVRGPMRRVVDLLAVADRPVGHDILRATLDIDDTLLVDVLRGLERRRLLRTDAQGVNLSHPLLAEAYRRHLLSGQAPAMHGRLARALAASASPAPAEVALHAQRAGEVGLELAWRVRAARSAETRLAFREEVAHWLRVIDLWRQVPDAESVVEEPWAETVLGSVRALFTAGRMEEAVPLARELVVLAPGLEPGARARALRRAGQVLGTVDPGTAEELATRALREYELLGDDRGMIGALGDRSIALRSLGRNRESEALIEEALTRARQLGDADLVRETLIERAWLAAASGDEALGLALADEATALHVPDAPMGDVRLATYHTDLLLFRARGPVEVAAAARDGLEVVAGTRGRAGRENGLRHWVLSTLLVCNVAEAHLDAGDVEGAWRIIEPETRDEVQQATRFLHLTRACVEVARGELVSAASRVGSLQHLEWGAVEHRLALARASAAVALAVDRPDAAFDAVASVLAVRAPGTSTPTDCLGLALAARAAADLGDAHALATVVHLRQVLGLEPGHHVADVGHAASGVAAEQVLADLERGAGADLSLTWSRTARAWDTLSRPHDAAYCRWRGAQAACREGHGIAAHRLLARAAADARTHIPLRRAIAATTV